LDIIDRDVLHRTNEEASPGQEPKEMDLSSVFQSVFEASSSYVPAYLIGKASRDGFSRYTREDGLKDNMVLNFIYSVYRFKC